MDILPSKPVRRPAVFLLLLYATVLLLGALVRAQIFDRVLPAFDYPDESNMFLLSVAMRGADFALGDAYGAPLTGAWLQGYPPLFPWMGVWAQQFMEATSRQFLFPYHYVLPLRILAALAGILSTALVMATAKALAHSLAGGAQVVAVAVTGLVWALSPAIVEIGTLAIPDSFIPLACGLCLWCSIQATRTHQPAWLAGAVMGAIGAIYLKYSLVFALWLPASAAIFLLMRVGWRRLLPWLIGLGLVSAFTAGYLIWGYGALALENQEAARFRDIGLTWMLSPDRNRVNLGVGLGMLMNTPALLMWYGAGLAAYGLAWRRGRRLPHVAWLLVLVPYVVGNVLITSSVVYADAARGGYSRLRYLFPAAQVFSIGLGFSVGLLLQSGQGAQRVWKRLWQGSLLLAFLASFLLPALTADLALMQRYALPDTRLLLWRWSDASLPADGKILVARESRHHLTWNRPYSGYDGQTPFEWVHDDFPETRTADEWAQAGISYFVADERDLREIHFSADAQAFREQLTLLKVIPGGAGVANGATTYVWRMLPPQVPLNEAFGDIIVLAGYDLSTTAAAPGDNVTLRPYWQAMRTPPVNYSMFVHLYPAGGSPVLAQVDGAPAGDQRLPATWDDPAELIIGRAVQLALPEDLPSGEYTLALGLYNFETGERLRVGDSDHYAITLTVNGG